MPKVNTKSLRSLANKVQPSILTGAINESADYIDKLEQENERLHEALETAIIFLRSNDLHIKAEQIKQMI